MKISSENLKFSSVQARLIFFKIRALGEPFCRGYQKPRFWGAPHSSPRKAPLAAPSPALPPAPRIFAALFPALSPAIFWISPFLSSVAGHPDLKPRGYLLGQKRCRTKVSRIFRFFVPNFAPNFAPNFPRIFRGVFVLHFVGDGDQKKFTKNQCNIFQCKIPSQTRKKYSQNSSGEQAE